MAGSVTSLAFSCGPPPSMTWIGGGLFRFLQQSIACALSSFSSGSELAGARDRRAAMSPNRVLRVVLIRFMMLRNTAGFL